MTEKGNGVFKKVMMIVGLLVSIAIAILTAMDARIGKVESNQTVASVGIAEVKNDVQWICEAVKNQSKQLESIHRIVSQSRANR